MNSRAIAGLILQQVIDENVPLNTAIEKSKQKHLKFDNLVNQLCFGTLRKYYLLEHIVQQLLGKPIRQKDSIVLYLLLIGCYQLLELRISPHAAIYETVNAAKHLNKDWAAGLVNAILRKVQKQSEKLLARADSNLVASSCHPEWLLKMLKLNYPDVWRKIVIANNQPPPLSLRVNRSRISRDEYLAILSEKDIPASIIVETNCGINVEYKGDITELPFFQDGYVSVQDGAAQLAAELVAAENGDRILDACSAPGGKTCHLLESLLDIDLVSLELYQHRANLIHTNLQRLGFTATVIVGDVTKPNDWWDGKLFDKILLDVPCSATGIIRRRPDIKLHRSIDGIDDLVKIQKNMLIAAWQLLKPGGSLLYATCSILPVENTKQIEQFIISHANAIVDEISIAGVLTNFGVQILPSNLDGFFYARIKKNV